MCKKSRIIKTYTTLDYKASQAGEYLKAKLVLKDESVLFLKEYISSTEHVYSYHWQNNVGELLIRWDNAPHHKALSTFPHHKHAPELEESYETSFEDVLKVITDLLNPLKDSEEEIKD